MSRQRSGGRRNAALIVGATASALVFLALAAMAARGQFFGVDRDVHAFIRAEHPLLDTWHPMFGAGIVAVSALGDWTGLVPVIALLSLSLWRGSRHQALLVPLVMVGTWLLQFVAKWAVDRPRPSAAPWGFPSGHVLSLVVLLGLVAYFMSARGTRRRWRYPTAVVCGGIVFAVAVSRLYLNAHWISDVAGGLAVGLAYLLAVILVVESSPARLLRRRAHAALPLAVAVPAGAVPAGAVPAVVPVAESSEPA